MYKQLTGAILLAGLMVLGANTAEAKWHHVADLSVDGKDAQEVSLDRDISHIRIACTEGSIIINSVVVRTANGGKDGHTVGKRIEEGDATEIDLDNEVKCTGLRISQDGHGKYKVEVK